MTNDLNSIASHKYGISPNFLEKNTQQDEKLCEIYDFYGLVKVQKYSERYKRNDIHKDIFACLLSIHNTISLSCHE